MTTASVHRPTAVDDVAHWLAARPGRVRVRGGGSRQDELPAVDVAHVLELSALAGIVRIDAGDQTCTVECGVPCARLDEALAPHALELPCLGGSDTGGTGGAAGTIGGLFASDPFGPAGGTALGPKSLLLGMDAVLADGTPFRSGARVVKSVAGFDVHKLLVGSAGRLFVATRMHLRLKPRPRAQQPFANVGIDRDEALARLAALRREAVPPAELWFRRERDGTFAVAGRIVGRPAHVAATVRRLGLAAVPLVPAPFAPRGDEELVRGQVLGGRLPALLAALPPGAPLYWLGGGRFTAALPHADATDALLAAARAVPAACCIVRGAAARRRRGTALDDGEQRLAGGLKRALDPDGILV